jgi:hypothetical protein
MDVIPEIEARIRALESRIDALEDGQAHLTQQAQATGTLASATAGAVPPASQPGVIPAQAQAGPAPVSTSNTAL